MGKSNKIGKKRQRSKVNVKDKMGQGAGSNRQKAGWISIKVNPTDKKAKAPNFNDSVDQYALGSKGEISDEGGQLSEKANCSSMSPLGQS